MNELKDLSRKTLIASLIKVNPDVPRAFYEVMDDETLRAEFQSVANTMHDRIKEHQVVNVM